MEEQLQQIKNDSGSYQIFAGKLKYSKNFSQLFEYLQQKYSFLANSYNNPPNKLYFYFYFYNLNKVENCPICGKPLGISKAPGVTFYKTCGNSKCLVEFRNRVMMEKYGVRNISKSEAIKQKKIETCRKNYGVDFPQQSKQVLETRKNANLQKYGVDSPMKLESVKDKLKQTFIRNFNCENVSQNQDIKNKKSETFKQNYIIDNIFKTEDFKAKNKIFQSKKIFQYFKDKFKDNDKYIFIDYNEGILTLQCKKCNEVFKQTSEFFAQRERTNLDLCLKCKPFGNITKSNGQIELYDFIKLIYNGEILQNDRKILNGKEIDIYIPELKIGFEFNGVYWHSTIHKPKNYHQNKKIIASKLNINLINIWEDDWNLKRELVESRIKNLLGKTEHKIFARKCKIIELDSKTYTSFLKQNHLQGSINSKLKFGLLYEDKLVSVMGIGSRYGQMELLRFCNLLNYNVVGAFSKFLKYFKKLNPNSELISYADLDWSNLTENVYLKSGMNFVKITNPGFFYYKNGVRFHRLLLTKEKLLKMDLGKPEQSADDILNENNFLKCYNSGNLLFKL